ncbi:hypothetical protein [Desulfitobacterium hafniense]|uniref:hypothetical protein n=1 Tax=Desulfitobacterium hafniense TaxID=49338 RepID=UPI001F600433|nr:hypothetical protein [Desulfitobacterium hafniense]
MAQEKIIMLHSKQFVVQHYNLIGIERDKSMKPIHKGKKDIGFQIRSLNHLINMLKVLPEQTAGL